MYQLAPYVFACNTGRHSMFLDLRRDRYLSVPQSQMNELAPCIADWNMPTPRPDIDSAPPTSPKTLIDDLLDAGIIIPLHHESPSPPAHLLRTTIAKQSVFERETPASPNRKWLSALYALFYADCLLRSSTLWRIIQMLSSNAEHHRHNLVEVELLTRHFLSIRPWYPRNYLCLFDSLALLIFLLRRGIRAQWIFGVREEPFAAHCWVQYDILVLNEYLDKTHLYTPIMII